MRRRNASSTRDAILEAARVAFTQHSFDQVGVREITNAASVNGSLVNRYFGTKEKLFAEVMRSGSGIEALDTRTLDEALGLLADRALERSADRSEFDPVLAMIRSAPVETAQPVLREYLNRHAISPLALQIGGVHSHERASMIVAFLIGVIILRSVIKIEALASTTRNDLSALIAQAVRRVAGETDIVR